MNLFGIKVGVGAAPQGADPQSAVAQSAVAQNVTAPEELPSYDELLAQAGNITDEAGLQKIAKALVMKSAAANIETPKAENASAPTIDDDDYGDDGDYGGDPNGDDPNEENPDDHVPHDAEHGDGGELGDDPNSEPELDENGEPIVKSVSAAGEQAYDVTTQIYEVVAAFPLLVNALNDLTDRVGGMTDQVDVMVKSLNAGAARTPTPNAEALTDALSSFARILPEIEENTKFIKSLRREPSPTLIAGFNQAANKDGLIMKGLVGAGGGTLNDALATQSAGVANELGGLTVNGEQRFGLTRHYLAKGLTQAMQNKTAPDGFSNDQYFGIMGGNTPLNAVDKTVFEAAARELGVALSAE